MGHIETTPVYVTRPYLPPLEEYVPYLETIWENKHLTNSGPLHTVFETELSAYLNVPYVSLFANGTLALITALQSLGLTGEIITTPYSFVATTNAIVWNNCTPVFADIDPATCNLDPVAVEAAITPNTTAILAVHVYGTPCDVEALEAIAKKHDLKLIYDAAHAFGVQKQETSILSFGDLSIVSFHATKIFHTFEGGLIVSHTKEMKAKIDSLKNFGFETGTSVTLSGMNAKMNEPQAAMGLLQLRYIDTLIEKRKTITNRYRELLKGITGVEVLEDMEAVTHCYSYMPVFIDEETYGTSRDAVQEALRTHNIFARRYFYPLISQFAAYKDFPSAADDNVPISCMKTERVLCLPIYPDLSLDTVTNICDIIREL